MDGSLLRSRNFIAAVILLTALPVLGQETCAEHPGLSSCSTNPVGVCDAEAARQYVIENGNNHWLVIPVEHDPLYPGQCSYEDTSDAINTRKITAKDDTNNLQCALDFAAAQRDSEDAKGKITLQKGRYCIRDQLIGLDFSGTIAGAGKGKTIVDFDNPALKDAQGNLTGEGGFEREWDITKSVVSPSGEFIELLDRVEYSDDQPETTTSRRYYNQPSGALVFASNRYNSRNVTIKDLQFNAGKATRAFTQTIHGYTNVLARPLSISSFVTDNTVLGGESLSFGGRSDELYSNGCAWTAEDVYYNNGGQPWYEQETGFDLSTPDSELCVVPINNSTELESPIYPRNCGENSCAPVAYDLSRLPEINTRFIRILATGRGNTNNGLYYLNSERNRTIDSVVSGDEVISITQPVKANLQIKDSVLRGLGSEFVGSIIDFGGSPVVDSKVKIQNNTLSIYRENGETYGCGRLWERLSLSDSTISFHGNNVNGCQGTDVRHAYYTYRNSRGIDGASNLVGASQQPIPGPSKIVIQGNDYKQGPVMAGIESPVVSFFRVRDWLNNINVETAVGAVFPSLTVFIINNAISIADYTSDNAAAWLNAPIVLNGINGAKVRGNTINGSHGVAIAIGQEPEAPGDYDVGARVINNDLSGFSVVPCSPDEGFTDACATGTPELDEAANAKVWLGPNSSDALVIVPESDSYAVGDLSDEESGNRVRD
jgi:hypothetical protein